MFAPLFAKLDLDRQKLTRVSEQNGSRVSCRRVERRLPKFERVGLERSTASSSVWNQKSGMLLRSSDLICNWGSHKVPSRMEEVTSEESMAAAIQFSVATRWHHKDMQSLSVR